MSIERVLVVEDDELGRESVTESLQELGIEVLGASDGHEALALLATHDVDLVLSDLRMAGMGGLELLDTLARDKPELGVALMTAHGTLDVAVQALRCGAEDILLKPFGPDQLALLIERLQRRRRLALQNRYLRAERDAQDGGSEIVGKHPSIQEVLSTLRRVADSKASVFVRGQSGTGKELAARALHQWSDRRDGPFIRVNCAALSETLLESELFGHERGAFTGATTRREGRFELADGGTLLLDEVSEISPHVQAKLLRVLEEEEFERVGGTRTLRVDVRVVATSNRDLEEAIREGEFREDLFWRLHVVPVHLPSLRERASDVPHLLEAFLHRYADQQGRPRPEFSDEALGALLAHDWPGNVRELANLVQRCTVLAQGARLEAHELGLPARAQAGPVVQATAGRTVDDVERELILATLGRLHGNRTRTAAQLGITARTICNKIRLYRSQGFDIPAPRRGRGARKAQECPA